MANDGESIAAPVSKPSVPMTLDLWAVLLAFVLALLVRAGVFQQIPW